MIKSRINKSNSYNSNQPSHVFLCCHFSIRNSKVYWVRRVHHTDYNRGKLRPEIQRRDLPKRMEERVIPSTCSVDKRTIYHVLLNDTRPLHVYLMSSIDSTIGIPICINLDVELKLSDSNQRYISPLKINVGPPSMSKTRF